MFFPQYDVGQEDWEQFLGFCQAWLSNDSEYDHNNDDKVDFRDFAYYATIWGPFPSNQESHFYYLTDTLGSVRGLIGGKFNREEDREFYNYDVYGATTDSTACGNPFMFAGYRYDAESGLYFLINRSYDANTGRFLQLDEDYYDSMNLYEYAKSNPVRYVDPFGTSIYNPDQPADPTSLAPVMPCIWKKVGKPQNTLMKEVSAAMKSIPLPNPYRVPTEPYFNPANPYYSGPGNRCEATRRNQGQLYYIDPRGKDLSKPMDPRSDSDIPYIGGACQCLWEGKIKEVEKCCSKPTGNKRIIKNSVWSNGTVENRGNTPKGTVVDKNGLINYGCHCPDPDGRYPSGNGPQLKSPPKRLSY